MTNRVTSSSAHSNAAYFKNQILDNRMTDGYVRCFLETYTMYRQLNDYYTVRSIDETTEDFILIDSSLTSTSIFYH